MKISGLSLFAGLMGVASAGATSALETRQLGYYSNIPEGPTEIVYQGTCADLEFYAEVTPTEDLSGSAVRNSVVNYEALPRSEFISQWQTQRTITGFLDKFVRDPYDFWPAILESGYRATHPYTTSTQLASNELRDTGMLPLIFRGRKYGIRSSEESRLYIEVTVPPVTENGSRLSPTYIIYSSTRMNDVTNEVLIDAGSCVVDENSSSTSNRSTEALLDAVTESYSSEVAPDDKANAL